MRYLVAALMGALIIAGLWGRYEQGRAEGWRDYAKRLESAGKANVASLKAEKAAKEAAQAQITKETNDATAANRRDAVDASNRWADAHRMRPSAKPAGGEAGTGLPEPAATAGSAEIPGEAIAVDRNTINACALNTADLNEAVEWARKTWSSK